MSRRWAGWRTRSVLGSSLVVGIGLAPVATSANAAPLSSPRITAVYAGVHSNKNSPPSPNIAASPTEEMEVTNLKYEIANRSGVVSSMGTMTSLFAVGNKYLTDPQVMWDPTTKRFYISMEENDGTTTPENGIAWGFSKTATPTGPSDFCTYFNGFNYGSTSFPDLEKLGDTSDFLLFTSNRYAVSNEDIEGSDVAWITKPPAGHTCPSPSSFETGIQSLVVPGGTPPYGPVAARQIDSSATGWIVTTPSYVSASTLSLFSVTRDSSNGKAIIGTPTSVPVPSYSYPPNAPQEGTTMAGNPAPPLETLIYLSQAYLAYDPRVGHLALWTAHTIAGGAGSEVRWYEINPAGNSLDQYGTVSDPNLYVFDGTIAPDRIVNGDVTAFGSNAAINVSTSSSTTYPAIEMTSTVNGQPESPLVMVKQSKGTYVDFSCFEPSEDECRWGDYSGTAPDPGASTDGTEGAVWSSNEWNIPNINDETPVWRTTIWRSRP
jgi:hypothetical protein